MLNVIELYLDGVEVNFMTDKEDIPTIVDMIMQDLRNIGLINLHDYFYIDEVYFNNKMIVCDLEIQGYTCKFTPIYRQEQIDIDSYLKGTILE